MERLPRAAVYRLAVLAHDVLLRACNDATDEPVKRDAIHRLALGYVLVTGCATTPHVRTIWKVLGHEGVFSQLSCRQAHYGIMLHGIRQNVERQFGQPKT